MGNNELNLNLKSVKDMKKTTKKSASVPASVSPATKPVIASGAKPTPAAARSKSITPVTLASKSATTSVESGKPASPARFTSTTIEARIDVGFGNQLFVRGEGEGLSWDRGIPLECVDSQTWRLVVPAKDKLQIKLLINDSVWAKGEDVVVTPGKRVELVPAF